MACNQRATVKHPFRYWLVDARQRRAMTQDQVARACGISRSAYQKYEYGLRTPGRPICRKLSRVLRVREDAFYPSERKKNEMGNIENNTEKEGIEG